ncbi:MAG: rod shape-determining protein MreC [Chloroflexi bacterium RBG_19FT_COMBO_47_9]|nr:MAG: rod shape-determining protein MreC [Chloroflexi bacterium RBG_19FT_COMBO_47_9]
MQIIYILLVAFGLIGLALGGYLTPISRILINPIVSAQSWLAKRYQAVQSLITQPEDVTTLRQQNTALEAENSSLQVQIVELQQQVSEAQLLSTLVDYERRHVENQYTAAAVIARDVSPFMHYVIINRGSDDGLRKGMPVITQQGLLGSIAAVTAGAARVQLINDPGSSINVILQQSGVEGVLNGLITGEIELDMISQNATIQPGDLVITSGLGGNYPANIVIGQVVTIRSDAFTLFQSASVQPAVDFSQLEIVLIITNFQPVDISPLIPSSNTP